MKVPYPDQAARKGDEFDIDIGIFVCWSGQADNGPHKPDDLRNALRLIAPRRDAVSELAKRREEILCKFF